MEHFGIPVPKDIYYNRELSKDLNKYLGALGSGFSMLKSSYDLSNPNLNGFDEGLNMQLEELEKQKQRISATSIDDLLGQMNDYQALDNSYELEDYYKGPSTADIFSTGLNNTISGATTGASIGGIPGAVIGGVLGLGSSIIGGITGRNKAKDAASNAVKELRDKQREVNDYRQNSFKVNMDTMLDNNIRNMTTQLAFGGALPGYGGDWSNGLNFIKTGNSHEQNPIGGVPMGMAEDGTPNLVEEGEVIWNDYVFSNRLKVPNKIRETYNIKGKDDMTFAEAVEKLQKASSERPNDPIEKRTLNSVLSNLMQEQEVIRQEKNEKEQFNQMEDMAAYAADGGPIHIAKNKRGTFTAAATKHGMGVQEFASHVLSNKDKYSTAMVKKAVFAHNSKSWSHADGGPLGRIFKGEGEYPNYLWGTNPQTDFNQGYDLLFKDYSTKPRLTNKDVMWLRNPVMMENSPLMPTPSTAPVRHPWSYGIEDLGKGIAEPAPVLGPYNPGTATPGSDEKESTKDKAPSNWETWLRYAPVLGASVGLGYTLFNRPDHKYANELEATAREVAGNTPRVSYNPIGDYLAYNPFDRLFYANELGAQQAATRRGIVNTGNGNIGSAMAGLLASGYNDNIGLGKLYRAGEEYNLDQRQKVADFNRGTNMFNSEADLKAQMTNAEMERANANLLLDAKMKALGLKQVEDQAWDTSLAANLTNLFDNIGNIGWEAVNRNMINSNLGLYYGIGRDGNLYYKNAYNKLSPEEKAKVDEQAAALGIKVKKNGGYLTIKNRRRR